MYTTIEANIENGHLTGPEADKLPAHAHVLITLLSTSATKRPAFGTHTSEIVKIHNGALAPLSDSELSEWGI